jgi:hypothetical protein
MFLWASYVAGQDMNAVWWSTELVSGYKRGPECRSAENEKTALVRRTENSQQMTQYEPPAPPICLRGALEGGLGVYDYG